MSKDDFMSKLADVKNNLDEVIKILSFEPEESTESKFCNSAQNLRLQLNAFSERLKKL